MTVAERTSPLPAAQTAGRPSTRRFFQRYGTLLILLGLCLVFTVIGLLIVIAGAISVRIAPGLAPWTGALGRSRAQAPSLER